MTSSHLAFKAWYFLTSLLSQPPAAKAGLWIEEATSPVLKRLAAVSAARRPVSGEAAGRKAGQRKRSANAATSARGRHSVRRQSLAMATPGRSAD